MASRHLKTTILQCFLTLVRSFEWPQFPKLRLLWRQNCLRIFLPFGSAGFCLRAWPLGPWLPRPKTAAFRSRMGPRFGPRAAHRGQGGGGCEGRRRPWPRTKDFGETLLRQWDLHVTKWMKCWSVVETAFINVSMVYQDKLVALFVFATGSFPTPRCAAEKQDFRRFQLANRLHVYHLSQSKNCSFSLEGCHSNDHNVS